MTPSSASRMTATVVAAEHERRDGIRRASWPISRGCVVCAIVLAARDPALAAGMQFRAARRRPRRRDHRRAHLPHGRWPRGASCGHRDGERNADGIAALSALVAGRDVTLRGESDAPDRYGRQPAFVFADQAGTSVQSQLLAQGEALVSGTIADKACAAELVGRRGGGPAGQARSLGRSGGHKKRGKSGRYFGQDRAVYRGRGEGSVGAAGRGGDLHQFRPALDTRLCGDYFKARDADFEAAGIVLKSLENKRIRVRGLIEARGGPRIEALRAGQIELAGEN